MAESGWLGHAIRMGRFDYQRSVRAIREDTGRLILLAGGAGFMTLLLTVFSILFVPELRGADLEFSINRLVRGTLAMLWVFGVFMLAQRTTTAHSKPVADAFVLTTVSPRTAVVGGIVAESLRVLTYVFPVGLLLTIAGAYTFSAPLTLLAVPLVGSLYIASAVTVGRLLGYCAAWLVATVPFVARHKGVLGGTVAMLFFGTYFLFQARQLPISISPTTLGVIPIGWLADLLVVGTSIGWSSTHALGGVVAVSVVIISGIWLSERIATSFWFGESVTVSDAGKTSVSTRTEGDQRSLKQAVTPLGVPFITGPTRHVAEWFLLRARREPQRLNFLLIPVFGGGSALVNMMLQGSGSLAILGPASAVLLGWTAGAAFGLNPFGDEGAVLPTTLTAVSGQAFVRGLIAPSLLFAPVVSVVTLVTALIGGYGPLAAIALTLIGCFLTVVGATLAPIVGMWFPRYSAIRIGNSDGVRPPRLLAGVLHVVLMWLPGAALVGLVAAPELVRLALSGIGYVPGFILGLVANGGVLTTFTSSLNDAGAAIQGFPLTAFRGGFGGLLIVAGLLVARRAYRRAVRRFETHELH
ncbi:hypothetical protein [Halostagnicola kamekurae]|uniref:ABC-2 type transport system permease protein n=1 Tax=Halostagnicola kamekurae TaxID=619731 RepID=A0A1I6QR15_9EURY|nr:hypothetical protein [Halostagnicola kamekurae]SFS54758.1 hypothetical protein SAMN04488556_1456 [Halostagnicola kamekurae]